MNIMLVTLILLIFLFEWTITEDFKMITRFRTKLSYALSLALVFSLMLAPLALADSVQNDVSGAIDNDTFTAGGSTSVGYKIQAAGGDGQSGCNASDGTPATVTINAPAGVTVTPGSLTFTACGVFQYITFSSDTPGNYATTVSVSDSGVGTYNINPAAFTLHVLAPPSDTTPPVITPNAAGTLGNNGWYVSDVTVSWSVVDNESAVTSTTGCGPTTIDYDTDGVTLTCTATSAGGTASESVTIKRDATPPVVSLVGGPEDGDSYYYDFVPDAPTCIASDAMSGLDGDCSVTGYSGDVGSHTVSASATDLAGNIGYSDEVSYTVLPYELYGFYQPVEMDALNLVKGGSTVPLKFHIFAGPLELTSVAYVQSLTYGQITCDVGAPTDEVETTTTGGTSLRYDADEGQFIYNWQTPRAPSKCYQVTMTTIDGSELSADFKLK
jgi:hypothetical protein